MRKATQIQINDKYLFALCDDGTIWLKNFEDKNFEWYRDDLPQEKFPDYIEAHGLIDTFASEFVKDTGRAPDRANILDLVNWSFDRANKAKPENCAPVWTSESPKEPGYYWWRFGPEDPEPEMVFVNEDLSTVREFGENMMSPWRMNQHQGEWLKIGEPK